MEITEMVATLEQLTKRLERLEKYYPAKSATVSVRRKRGESKINHYIKQIRSNSKPSKSK